MHLVNLHSRIRRNLHQDLVPLAKALEAGYSVIIKTSQPLARLVRYNVL